MERPVTIAKTTWVLTLSSIAVVVASLYLAKAILVPLTLAVLLSFMLSPIGDWIERWRLATAGGVTNRTSVEKPLLNAHRNVLLAQALCFGPYTDAILADSWAHASLLRCSHTTSENMASSEEMDRIGDLFRRSTFEVFVVGLRIFTGVVDDNIPMIRRGVAFDDASHRFKILGIPFAHYASSPKVLAIRTGNQVSNVGVYYA